MTDVAKGTYENTEVAQSASSFTLQGYESLIGCLRKRGYTVRHYDELEPDRADLILRHDVDFCLERAIQLGEREAELGVQATYFVLLTGEFYNCFSAAGRRLVRELRTLGHVVGLHCDPSLYSGDPDSLDRGVASEAGLLEDMLGEPVRLVSFHRPNRVAPHLLGNARQFGGREHTYLPKYFRDVDYCSDSGGGWAYGHPLERASVREGKALHLLTHPIWWVEKVNVANDLKLDRFIQTLRCRMRHALSDALGGPEK